MLATTIVEWKSELIQEGRQEGLQKGRQEGKIDDQKQIIRNMAGQGLDAKAIHKYTGINLTQINTIIKAKQGKKAGKKGC